MSRITEQVEATLVTVEREAMEARNGKTKIGAWPKPLAVEAFFGIAGEYVHLIEQYTESDPAGLLISFLVKAGSVIGAGPFARVEDDYHRVNLFALIVGDTSKGRKGTSDGRTTKIFSDIDPEWASNCIKSGLSSGEGLIYHVRDRIEKKNKKGVIDIDDGISDKRLLDVEPEFASILRGMAREGNKISPVLRQAWDTGNLSNLNKNSPDKATGAHISFIGHITADELSRYLTETEIANGFLNRFQIVCVRRSKVIPDPIPVPQDSLNTIVQRLRNAVSFARAQGEIKRDESARKIWRGVYEKLSSPKSGLFGSAVSRGEAQVLRLSILFAVLDGSQVVREEHLLAALAIWDYCEDSARFIFGESLGDPVADAILRALRNRPSGMTRTDISNILGRNAGAGRISSALAALIQKGLARFETRNDTGGRAVEVWYAA